MEFTTAEELDAERSNIQNKRLRKLADRNKGNGDGLRMVKRTNNRNQRFIVDEDENIIDLTRVTKLSDVKVDDSV